MKALSLTHPWATLVAIGAKRLEARPWGTRYRGLVAIHAFKNFPKDCRVLCLRQPFQAALNSHGLSHPFNLPLGCIVAVAEIADCFKLTADIPLMGRYIQFDYLGPGGTVSKRFDIAEAYFGDLTKGRYVWEIANVRRLKEPIACKGALGLWNVPEDVVAKLRGHPCDMEPRD